MELLEELLENGTHPLELLEAVNDALLEVGALFSAGTYYMTGLVLAGYIAKKAADTIIECLPKEERASEGLVILGTMQGDFHDLGKNMVSWQLKAKGFEVIDLGVDVPARIFLKEILQKEPDIVGISLLHFESILPLRKLLRLVKSTFSDSPSPPIFVGCGFLAPDKPMSPLGEKERGYLKVDYVVHTAKETVELCQRLMEQKRQKS